MAENERNEPTPEQIKYVLQQSILRNYPNPERMGCPGRAAIEAAAERRVPPEDPNWQHVRHCSPCYEEYLQARDRVLSERRHRRRVRVGAIAAGVTAVIVIPSALLLNPSR